MPNRRELLTAATALAAAPRVFAAARPASGPSWVSTSRTAPWQAQTGLQIGPVPANLFDIDVVIAADAPAQTMTGFGGAFSEKSWQALQILPERARGEVLDALFADSGAGFTMGRTPIGANDMARGWYSYDETPGDFALDHFSVDNDRTSLIPYLRAALERQPKMNIWASPWSPPTWMKTNGHYAQAPAWPGQPSNGLKPEQARHEGQDVFVQEDRYFDAYARYFRRYVEAYRAAGVPVGMVMPQNEFNSAQPFPSCCWTPEGLARFIPHLGREMGQIGVDIFFGTLERGNADLLSKVLADPAAGPLIKGVGVQWAGKGALAVIQSRHPTLTLWGSEQECGLGGNNWHYARYGWQTMRQYFNAGASAWHYWNMVAQPGGWSGWGWPQNSLVTVDPVTRAYRFNPEYYLLKHLSAFVKPGAKRLPAVSFFGFENQLAFKNPDGSVVIVAQNDMSEPLRLRFKLDDKLITAVLPLDSFNTIVV